MKVLGIAGNMGTGKDTVAELLAREHGFVTVAFADALKRLARDVFMYDEPTLFGSSEMRNRPDPRVVDDRYWVQVFCNADQFADRIVQLFDDRPEGLLPADTILMALNRAIVHLYLTAEKQGHLAPRYVLQYLGTEWGRALWDKVWTNSARVTILAIQRGSGYHRFRGLFDRPANHELYVPGVVVTDARFPNEITEIKDWGGTALWIDASARVAPKYTHASEPRAEDFAAIVDGVIDNNGTLDDLEGRIAALAGGFTA